MRFGCRCGGVKAAKTIQGWGYQKDNNLAGDIQQAEDCILGAKIAILSLSQVLHNKAALFKSLALCSLL